MSTLTKDYLRTKIHKPKPILTGMDSKINGWVGKFKGRQMVLRELLAQAQEIDDQAYLWKDLTDDQLSSKLANFKQIFRRRSKGYEANIPQALAAIREASDRKLGLRPYNVQLAGALAFFKGYIAEMSTGEGKTLTAALAAVMQGWVGLPCHVVTVNDYLAERDAKWVSPLFKFCDVSVGCVTGSMELIDRQRGHSHDVTYTTSKEIIADFLRDRLRLGTLQNVKRRQIRKILGSSLNLDEGLVMRGIHTVIVDEADCILIDEAVTPLIISQKAPNDFFVNACKAAYAYASTLHRDIDYTINEKYKEIELNPNLRERLFEQSPDESKLYAGAGTRLEMVQQALNAKEFFHLDQHYIVQEGKVVIVDEFTGRLMPQRSWRAGLHQFVEAKENLEMTAPTETLVRLSFQRFYRFFYRIAGMTGTAKESSAEFWDIYKLPVITIPENRPCIRKESIPKVFISKRLKWRAIMAEIALVHNEGRPVLVGTRNVKDSEMLSEMLQKLDLPHRVLNAIRHKDEARIIAHAGKEGAITIATNMAGRGTDILLGPDVAEKGGLHVIVAECHESLRIDRQLFGRAARQGDPGSAQLFICLEDEIICRYIPRNVYNSIKFFLKKDYRYAKPMTIKIMQLARFIAQRTAYHQRRSVLRMDTWLDDSLSFAHGDVE